MMPIRILATVIALAALVPRASALPAPALEPVDHAVCRLIETAARDNGLPVEFMTRVVWRESSFRAAVVSPAGAQGIAQFMPQTARARGLADPFDPEQAIPKAARLLADLRQQYGGLAGAAAAYNAGPGRAASWLRGDAPLPAETRAYLHFVTAGGDDDETTSCLGVIAELRRGRGGEEAEPAPLAPWGVQLSGNFSKTLALASFDRARQRYAAAIGEVQPMIIGRLLRSRGTRRFYQVRVPAPTRQVAEALCGRIQAIGGACVAMRT